MTVRKNFFGHRVFWYLALFAILLTGFAASTREFRVAGEPSPVQARTFGLVVHGGAGGLDRGKTSAERQGLYRAKLSEAISTGHQILSDGGSALDCVEATIRILEDSPLFNAGKGAVFNAEGVNELDASIMDGATLKAGAVAGVRRVRNPIRLARAVMEKSVHVMLAGTGAEAFAEQQGIELVDPRYFFTQERWDELQETKSREKKEREKEQERGPGTAGKSPADDPVKNQFGTVGVVALDKKGNLAAGTSTGGMVNKRFGRVGDSPIIGAGTYADNKTCAVSATGHGEFFIRLGVARDISALMEYKGYSVERAANLVIQEKLTRLGGTGGVIAIDSKANITMPFNTSGMFRGWAVGPNPAISVAIFKDE